VTRSAICVVATVLDKLTDGRLADWKEEQAGATKTAEEAARAQTVHALVQLLRDALLGLATRVDRTSAYNCAALFFLARQALGPSDDAPRAFFDALVHDSELLSPDQTPLRLELLIIVDSVAKQNNAPIFAEAALNVCKARDQWPGFIDELRFPLKRPLKMREPMSLQERVTHRASVLAYLRSELFKGRTAAGDALAVKILRRAANANKAASAAAIVNGNLVNEDLSPEGGLPAVFLAISGNVLTIRRVEYMTNPGSRFPPAQILSGKVVTNSNNSAAAAGAAVMQTLPIVALSLTQDVSRPFVLHFCSPLCCGVAPFSVSFPSRQVAANVLKVLSDASSKLRERVLVEMKSELSQR
jgi:hypothetical protein